MNRLAIISKPVLQVFLLLVLAAGLMALSTIPKGGGTFPVKQGKGSLIAIDANRPWTPQWIENGVPADLKSQDAGGWAPWIAVNPQNIHETWWVWPLTVHNTMYFGRSHGSSIWWVKANIASPRGLPIPWREMLIWTHDFVQRQAPPSVPISPSSQAWHMGNSHEHVTGFMMAMLNRPKTLALGVLLKVPGHGWIQLVGLWQWQHRWVPRYLIINPQPAILNTANLITPPRHGLPLPLPPWAQ